MTAPANLDRFINSQTAHQIGGPLVHWLAQLESDDSTAFLEHALSLIRSAVDSPFAAVAKGVRGRWHWVAQHGKKQPLPTEVLSDALDQDQVILAGEWAVSPLETRSDRSELLAIHMARAVSGSHAQETDACSALLGYAYHVFRKQQIRGRRIARLEAILEIAAQWNQTHEMEPLLIKMAEASTKLLRAERASIFLWDRDNRILIGRPALGVDEGSLRIPDDTGIVGQVVHTGEPRRVDAGAAEEQAQIDRQVDKQLNYQTDSLLCVPLQGSDGQMLGAFEMINKLAGQFTDDDEDALIELASHAAVALENTQQIEQLVSSRKQMADQAAEGVQLIGDCPAIQALKSTIRRVADTELAVLILGENGSGKEVVAQMIHYLSPRRNEPLIAVNCAAISESLLESELFGHEKGAFTDAHETRAGKFELASGGTLFLDEIGDMSLGGQAKLLRVLEEKVVVRVGGSMPIHTDARVFAATNQNLAELVRQKKFREDLYYRLNVVTLDLPPLRERLDDVLLLAEFFLRDFCIKARRKPPKFTASAKKRLAAHPWPGNVRELRNLMERLAYLSQGDKIDADELAFILAPDGRSTEQLSLDATLTDATKRFQVEYIQRHIDAARGNMTAASQRLGLHRSNLYRKMRQLDMPTSPDEDDVAD